METEINVLTNAGSVKVKGQVIGGTYSGKWAKVVGSNGIVWLTPVSA
jgi:hypothetical protein